MKGLIEERDERTARRKKDKKRHDSEINLRFMDKEKNTMFLAVPMEKKALNAKSARLLDEGAIEGDGWIDCFIKKGTIEKFLNGENTHLDNIDDDYVGTVNIGHKDFATDPFIYGYWTKKDLHVVDMDNERKAIDVDLHLDYESTTIQELMRQPFDIGISAEFYYHLNQDDTEALSEEMGYYVPVFDEIQIFAYGLVGECGNVNSAGLELKGDFTMDKEKILKDEDVMVEDFEEKEEIEETEDIEEEEEIEEEDEDIEEVNDDEIEEEESEDEEVDDEEDDALSELSMLVETLTKDNETLKAQNESLKKDNRKLSKRLKAKEQSIEDFAKNFKDLSVSLGLKKEEKVEKAQDTPVYASNDGIGE